MIYLFLGNDAALKSRKINDIKAKHLTSKEALHFDYELLYADKLDKDDLKKALLNLPAVAKKRVVIIKQIEKLKAAHTKILSAFLVEKNPKLVLILESDQAGGKGKFISDVKRIANVTVCGKTNTTSAFDVTNAMQERRPVDALKTLSELIEGGEPPLRIMGALVWFWGQMRKRVSTSRFRKGLECLQEADLNIKRSRLKPEFALEKLVISLSALLA